MTAIAYDCGGTTRPAVLIIGVVECYPRLILLFNSNSFIIYLFREPKTMDCCHNGRMVHDRLLHMIVVTWWSVAVTGIEYAFGEAMVVVVILCVI